MNVAKNILITMLFLSVPGISSAADILIEEELLGIYGSEELISIATGYKQPVSKAPVVASVIDAEEIRRRGATNLSDILESVPGLHVARSHLNYNPIYTFRGIYSNYNPQVLLLVNGTPQTNLFTGARNLVWGEMPVMAIQRIEIIRGPGSAIYGADAFAGVINVITKNAENTDGLDVGARYGSFNTKDTYLSYGHQKENSDFAFFLETHKTDGHKEIIEADAQSWLDSITGTNASLAPGPVSMSRENLDMRLEYRVADVEMRLGYQGRRNLGIGAGIAEALDPSNRWRSDRYQIDLGYSIDDLMDDLVVKLSANYLDVSQEVEEDALLFPPGSTGPFLDASGTPLMGIFPDGVIGNPEVYERHTRLNALFHYTGISEHDLSWGLGFYYGDLYKVKEEKNYCTDAASCEYLYARGGVVDVSNTPYVFLREGDRKNYYLYIQDIINLANDWELTASVRYDHYTDFGETINPRLALVWSTTNSLTTKLLYGEAFRAPAFSETRNINNPAALGNPDLSPETLRSLELAFDYKPIYALNTIFNTFYYEWDDIIQFIPGPGGGNTAQNTGQQNGYGAELEAKWTLSPEIFVLANYSWQKSTNNRTDRDAANAPQQQFYVQANWEFYSNYNLNLQANWVMDRMREVHDPRDSVDDYVLVDMTLRKSAIWEDIDVALIVKNIFNEDAREPSPNGVPQPLIPNDLPLPGRQIMGEIRYQF